MVQGMALNSTSTVAPGPNPLVKLLLTIQRNAGEKNQCNKNTTESHAEIQPGMSHQMVSLSTVLIECVFYGLQLMHETENGKDYEIKEYLHRKTEDLHQKKQKLVYHVQHFTTACSIQSSSLVYVEQ